MDVKELVPIVAQCALGFIVASIGMRASSPTRRCATPSWC